MIGPVDPHYTHHIVLFSVLQKLGVLSTKIHRASIAASMIGYSPFKPQPHWLPLAIVSLALEYLEFIPMSEAKHEP